MPEFEQRILPQGFKRWHGGDAPVGGFVRVETLWSDGEELSADACRLRWAHWSDGINLIAYRT